MDMIGHNNRFIEPVPLPGKMAECIYKDRLRTGISQNARSKTLIEPILETLDKSLVVFASLLRRMRGWIASEPGVAFGSPRPKELLGKRIGETLHRTETVRTREGCCR